MTASEMWNLVKSVRAKTMNKLITMMIIKEGEGEPIKTAREVITKRKTTQT
jgi:hypothetical protein